MIKNNGKDCGVSINPGTSVDLIKPLLPMLDQVLVMTVNPGFGGQSFIDLTLAKIEELKRLKAENGYHYKINCDGGINLSTVEKARLAGTDVVVTGSAFFNSSNRAEFVVNMMDLSNNC
jgi:ribulose-phosphate 3-epimerase